MTSAVEHYERFQRMEYGWFKACESLAAAERDLVAARAEASELRSALVHWGEHRLDCAYRARYANRMAPPECDCGLAAALADAPEEPLAKTGRHDPTCASLRPKHLLGAVALTEACDCNQSAAVPPDAPTTRTAGAQAARGAEGESEGVNTQEGPL